MAEARGNLSIMGWGATLLSYSIASMAYAGLFTTEPWDTGGFGTLSFLIFIIGIFFFLIGLVMQIFGGEETGTAATRRTATEGEEGETPPTEEGPEGGGGEGPEGEEPPTNWQKVGNIVRRGWGGAGGFFRAIGEGITKWRRKRRGEEPERPEGEEPSPEPTNWQKVGNVVRHGWGGTGDFFRAIGGGVRKWRRKRRGEEPEGPGLASEAVEAPEGPGLASEAVEAPKTGARVLGAPPKARPGVPLVSIQQLQKWDSIISQNLFTGKDYPDNQPILHHHTGRIDEKITKLKNIRDVLREIEQRQGQFQHVDWSELFTKDPRKNYLQFFNRIVTDFERVKKSTNLGELQKIRDQWKERDNETFNNGTFNDLAIAIRRKLRNERNANMAGKAPKVSPPPMKETAMKKAAPEQIGGGRTAEGVPRKKAGREAEKERAVTTFGYPKVRYQSGSPVHLDIDDFNHALDRLNAARAYISSSGVYVLEKIPKNYQSRLYPRVLW